ncbi:hypothetical protein DFQ28_004732 [Apophysomyces sp. BC1034]|nr:hypothetical protein DFQ28_004732 [Apophysomyces sp. BC1034]
MPTEPRIDQLPLELVTMSCRYLDICSLMNLMDTCRRFRYYMLTSTSLWRRIVIDLKYGTITEIYAALRRLKDSNGLRFLVQEVIMDHTDDSMLSPIVMLVKFPHLKYLSARYRSSNTDLGADAKVLQEHLNCGTFQPQSLALKRLNIYHYNMSSETYFENPESTLAEPGAIGLLAVL